MNLHWMVFPIVIPLLTAMACVLLGSSRLSLKRGVGLLGLLGSLGSAAYMLWRVKDGDIFVYQFGDWAIPFGIVFVLDRLSATMVMLTNVLGVFAFLYGIQGPDRHSPYFHFLFCMQITGVNGAFLTGDLFNLFVFFEILLLSAYVLVVYGSGAKRSRAGLHYVFINLFGSALFLIAVGVLYGVTGTLNMADMATKIAQVPAQDATLLRAASYLILIVFGTKAALFPLYFWLPNAYAAASAPVAAVFAIMTKVGAYTILRSSTLLFGEGQGHVANLIDPYLMPIALATLAMGVISALAAPSLRSMAAYLLIGSVGTIVAGFALFNADGISGALYYMVHSTLIMGALFLLAGLITEQRGPAHQDYFNAGPKMRQPLLLGMLFFITMIAVAGLPPLTGFLGKALILEAGIESRWTLALWTTVLITSFFSLVAIARGGVALFWKTEDESPESTPRSARRRALPILGLLACIVAMVLFAGPMVDYFDATAQQILNPQLYIESVLGEATR